MPDAPVNARNVGQIIYNLKDYRNKHNYISTNGAKITDIVYSDSNSYNATCFVDANDTSGSQYKKIYIYNDKGTNLIGKTNSTSGIAQVNKLGVQAPPGTKMMINGDKEIMVGRTGIYELDENFTVTELGFIRPRKYELSVGQTQDALNNGMTQLETAKKNFDAAVAAITAEEGTAEYWKQYNTCYSDYRREYQTAYALFLQGVNGIYIRPNENDADADENFEELENIIIDFLY